MSRPLKNPIKPGDQFNHLTVLNYVTVNHQHRKTYMCRCVCGKEVEAVGQYLSSGAKKSCGCRRADHHRHDLKGKRFGRLIALSLDKDHSKVNKTKWICECDCGVIKSICAGDLTQGRTTSCSCYQREKVREMMLDSRQSFNDIPVIYLNRVKSGAQKRNIPFDITIQDVSSQFEMQNRCCYFTGLPIGFDDDGPKKRYHTASIDRLDSKKGYTIDNICLVHKTINRMKNDLTITQFVEYCRLIVSKHSS